MKSHAFLALALALVFSMVACDQNANSPVSPPSDDHSVTIGEVHTEILSAIYADLDPVKDQTLARQSREEMLVSSVNRISDKYGLDRLTPEEIFSYVEMGRQMAQQDPVLLIANALSPEEVLWWERFSWEATVQDAGKVYNQHVQLYGAPEPGSMLAQITDVALSSAKFWDDYRGDEEPIYRNPYIPTELKRGWKKNLLRFAVAVVVDGVSGGLAGAGGGGVVGAGIVGGLASHGADDILFGE